jgi:hypothetical protein
MARTHTFIGFVHYLSAFRAIHDGPIASLESLRLDEVQQHGTVLRRRTSVKAQPAVSLRPPNVT